MSSSGAGTPVGKRWYARRKTIYSVILAAALLAIVGGYVLLGFGSPTPWRLVHSFSGGACDGITTCHTPSFEVAAREWKAAWTIQAPSSFLVDVYIDPNGSFVPVSGGYVRGGLSGELHSPVGAGTWMVAFTAPDSSSLATIVHWTVEIWVR